MGSDHFVANHASHIVFRVLQHFLLQTNKQLMPKSGQTLIFTLYFRQLFDVLLVSRFGSRFTYRAPICCPMGPHL